MSNLFEELEVLKIAAEELEKHREVLHEGEDSKAFTPQTPY